jgi:tRNA(Ile)-lysidine synthase
VEADRAASPAVAAEPVEAAFGAAMAGFAPFEPQPRLAVAVSGGGDSLALCLLAADWAKAQGGDIVALTVDHRLRPESAAEAAAVGSHLAGHGIVHHVLVWRGGRPASGLQAQARAARYALLGRWCRAAGVLHLLLGHHARDQAETVLMRALSGSGTTGLAGMQGLVETSYGRILRPLLAVTPDRLAAWLAARDLAGCDDPSNRDPAFTRVRLRFAGASLAMAGLDVARVNEVAALAAAARQATGEAVAALLAAAVSLHPAGFARVDRTVLAATPLFLVRRALARLLACIGGRRWRPGERAVDRLAEVISGGGPVAETLGGCRIAGDGLGHPLLVCREARNLPPSLPLPATGDPPSHPDRRRETPWDGRFTLCSTVPPAIAATLRLEPLGKRRAEALASRRLPAASGIPAAAWPSLPCLAEAGGDGQGEERCLARVVLVPHLGYRRGDASLHPDHGLRLHFHPCWPLSGGGHFPISP